MDLESIPKLSLQEARPYPFTFPLSTTALLLIDLQRDFLLPGGFGAEQCRNSAIFDTARAIVPTVQRVLAAFRSFDGHVIHTREGHLPSLADLPANKRLRQKDSPTGKGVAGIGDEGSMGRLLVRGEYGHDIVDELAPWPSEEVVDKPGKGSFWGTGLHRILLARGITHLVFAGVTTECCVSTTMRECNDRGFECVVLEDCTAGFDPSLVQASLNNLCAYNGLFGYTSSSTALLSAIASIQPTLTQLYTPISPLPLTTLPSIPTLLRQYKAGHLRPTQTIHLVHDLLEHHRAHTDPAAWISIQPRDACVQAAAALEAKYANGGTKPLPPLYGIPFSAKDTLDVAGVPTTAACAPAYAYTPTTTAVAVQLALDAGALFVGKTNHDQLATGLSGCRSPYGTPHSVFSAAHIAGGSSSGAAVSVAAGLVSFALATDTAGSGRVPAALNGVVGLKPTKGTVSARGLVPAIRTMDTISVMARSVGEARRVWRVIARPDPKDDFSKVPAALPTWHVDFRGMAAAGFTFAVPPSSSLEVCSAEYRDAFGEAVAVIQRCGGRLVDSVDYSIFEKAGNLLYDASLLYERMTCIGETFLKDNINDLHPVIRQLFQRAMLKPPSACDVFRDQALQAALTRKAQMTFDVLQVQSDEESGTAAGSSSSVVGVGVDVLVVPTTTRHPTIAEMERDPLALNAQLGTFTHCANVVDLCGVAVPAGRYVDGESGVELPFGVVILGGSGRDAKVVDIATVVEKALGEIRRGKV